ncbi:MAG: hypothetical protein MUP30_11755 [Deltaproteobacteria bacterium]|nr:hypothetical protein [Deltaproteobacteria bacterium]
MEALDKEINTELVKISPILALINAKTPIQIDYYCEKALIEDNAIKKLPSSDQPENQYIYEHFRQEMEKEKAQSEVLCEVLKKAQIHISKIVNIALEKKRVPSNCYLFYAFVEKNAESDDYVAEPIPLLFETLKDCKIAEEVLRDYDIGTRKCRQWQSSESFKSEEFFKKVTTQKKGNK